MSLTELLLLSLTLRLPATLTRHLLLSLSVAKGSSRYAGIRLDHIEAMFAFFILWISQAMVALLSTF
ncbi:MAG TPA: hypothetical protein VN831_23910 [Bradyrhizobium sp.]|nr:hypothetical protein [Bradyrhizobium sp.]